MLSLTEIAEDILANAKRVDAYTKLKASPSTSFDNVSLAILPADIESARLALVNSTQTLKRLAQGPKGAFMEILYGVINSYLLRETLNLKSFKFTDLVSLRAIYSYNLPKHVPFEGSVTFAEISRSSSIGENLLRRFFHHAMTNGIFAEPLPGSVAHSAFSRMLLTDSDAFDALGLVLEELMPASSKLLPALAIHPNSGEPNETAFNVENKTSMPMFRFFAGNPERARRLGAGMKFFTQGEGFDLKHLVVGYDWKSLDRPGAVVVDVGGGHGAVSQALAAATTNISFIVQDLGGTVDNGTSLLPETLKDRVMFMTHDFFTEQVVKEADMYLFRWIFHNWSDKYCVKILQNLIPAMKRCGKVVIYEYALEEKSDINLSEKLGRDLDLIMMTLFNSGERTVKDWQRLFELADSRFVFQGVEKPPGSTMSVIEAVWMPR